MMFFKWVWLQPFAYYLWQYRALLSQELNIYYGALLPQELNIYCI
jgi:hypothetical protein